MIGVGANDDNKYNANDKHVFLLIPDIKTSKTSHHNFPDERKSPPHNCSTTIRVQFWWRLYQQTNSLLFRFVFACDGKKIEYVRDLFHHVGVFCVYVFVSLR